jgi:hypothetical protein
MTQAASSRSSLWLVSGALSSIFTAAQIQSSLRSGSLSLPVAYDDVTYFNDALARLDLLYREGGAVLIKSFWTNPPHSPLETLLAMAGFGLLGPHPYAADAMNAIPLAILLRLFLGFAVQFLSLPTAILLSIALLGFPLFGMLALEFRPDALCALLTAAGAVIIVADPAWREGKLPAVLTASALFAGALLSKSTISPVTVIIFGVATLATICLQARKRDDAKIMVKISIVSGGIGALIALPYYVTAFSHLFRYITDTMTADIWRVKLTSQEHALYYLTGPGGNVSIGHNWLSVAVVAWIVGIALFPRHKRTAVGLALVGLTGYLAVTVPATKSGFLGMIVAAFVLCLSAMVITLILSRSPRWFATTAVVLLMLFSITEWKTVAVRFRGSAVPASQAQASNRILTQTVDALAAITNLGSKTLYVPVIEPYLNADNVEFELRRRGLSPPQTVGMLPLERDIVPHREALDRAQVIILFSDDSDLPAAEVPSSAIRKDISAMIAASGSFQEIATVNAAPFAGNVTILTHKGD